MDVILVPTTHWDREWYRTFQAFRARLVDTVDTVLQLLDDDDGYTFLLDGQSIVLEDYAEIRPGRRAELESRIQQGRVETGPWYVQPDSFLPGGEAHVRNLIEGRRAGSEFGPVSRVAYTPDSFGHPAQFPQLFAGFGMKHFVYWRGNADEITELPAEYAWESPDGTRLAACHLGESYSNLSGLSLDIERAVKRTKRVVEKLAARTNFDRALLLAGTDHQPPQPHTRELCEALAEQTGWKVRRGLLRDYVDGIEPDGLPTFRGELMGGRIANLLPGVWSTRTYLKIRNRTCETQLDGWAEPWSALAGALGAPDERPSLRLAWRQLLQNQAHDSICGCSQDAVHEQMLARYDAADELARETTSRMCERIAGLNPQRRVPFSDELDIAVFNPSPRTRTEIVRFNLDAYPPFAGEDEPRPIHPLIWSNMRPTGYTIDGTPARLVPNDEGKRVRFIEAQRDWAVEFVATDVPALGWKRLRLKRVEEESWDETDDGRDITNGSVTVTVHDDGTFTARIGGTTFELLGSLEDTGDRGDTYDYDPVPGEAHQGDVTTTRTRHANGIQTLVSERLFAVPLLTEDRSARSDRNRFLRIVQELKVAPGVDRVDIALRIENEAPDHRLRMLFPTGVETATFETATTFDVATRSTAARDASAWLHPAPTTFPNQGWVHANGLTVVAPGLNESEVTADGTIAITLLRCTGWLSRMDLHSRPQHAGPGLPTPGAQCIRTTEAVLSLFAGLDPNTARDAELGVRAFAAGDAPMHRDGDAMVALEPHELVLSALKPADAQDGFVLRVLNPTDDEHEAVVHVAIPLREAKAVRLDEEPSGHDVTLDGGTLRFVVPPHALRSVLCA
jgi:2-O-(6-phospho-alpha-D-mannosyl)-D-glycerate hydrolase